MIFSETSIKGAYVIDIEEIRDERGFFARSWCADEFSERNLVDKFVQCNISFNNMRGTIRGMHYQSKPYEETKLVRCTRGAIFDVIIDLRPKSNSYCSWFSVELSSLNYKMLYIPNGVAHGFQTLENNTEVFYHMSEFYHPECSRGVRWNDSVFSINWPVKEIIASSKDQTYPDFVKEDIYNE